MRIAREIISPPMQGLPGAVMPQASTPPSFPRRFPPTQRRMLSRTPIPPRWSSSVLWTRHPPLSSATVKTRGVIAGWPPASPAQHLSDLPSPTLPPQPPDRNPQTPTTTQYPSVPRDLLRLCMLHFNPPKPPPRGSDGRLPTRHCPKRIRRVDGPATPGYRPVARRSSDCPEGIS